MAGETLGPCVEYAGTKNKGGYGVLPKAIHGSRLAHRAALAEGLGRPVRGHALHTCDNPPCVAREHLYEGDQARNMQDKVERGRTTGRFRGVPECIHGHAFTPDNVRIKRYADGRVERLCLTCHRRRHQEEAARRKAARQMRKIA